MKAAFYILLATLLTLATSYSLGVFLLRGLGLKLERSAERFFAFVSGSALLSTFVFLLTAAGLARKSAFVWVSLPILALGAWKRVHHSDPETAATESLRWRAAFWIVFSVFAWYYLGNAIAPEVSPDGVSYHVGLPARYLREHHFPAITTNMYASLSQGVEMLFLYAFSIGRHSAAAMVHFLFLLSLVFGIRSYARWMGRPVAGIIAALLVYLSPVVGRDGTVAYVDLAAAAVAFALFYALQRWRATPGSRWLILIGLLAGFGFAVKYTLGLGIAYALAVVVISQWRRWRSAVAAAFTVGTCALVMMAPWLIKNTIVIGNPLAPFANKLFPNPYTYPSFETEYVEFFRHMNGVNLSEVPVEAAVKGERLTGVLGPVFLLLPLGLLALRRPEGRQLLLAAAVFLLPYFNNIGTRFLIPMLPFASLALALVLNEWRAAGPMIVLAHTFLSWPAVITRYSGQNAWRLERPNWNAALRKVPEEQFIRESRDDYDLVRMIEQKVPPSEWVFSPATTNTSYCTRNLIGPFESSLGKRMNDLLYRVTAPDMRTTVRHRFRFSAASPRAVRVVLTTPDIAPLLISEIRFWKGGQELPRLSQWRLTASVNPWDVQNAFDNSPITVWTVGRETRPGMFVQTDFGQSRELDEVTVDVSQNQQWASMRLEANNGDGRWLALGGDAQRVEIPWPARMRRAAMEEFRTNGMHWIALRDDDPISADFAERSAQWGVRLAGAASQCRLWQIE